MQHDESRPFTLPCVFNGPQARPRDATALDQSLQCGATPPQEAHEHDDRRHQQHRQNGPEHDHSTYPIGPSPAPELSGRTGDLQRVGDRLRQRPAVSHRRGLCRDTADAGEPRGLLPHQGYVEAFGGAALARIGQPSGADRVTDQELDGAGQLGGIPNRHEQTCLSRDQGFGHAPYTGCDRRHTGSHRLEQRHTETFGAGRQAEHVRRREQHPHVLYLPGQADHGGVGQR